MTNTRNIHINIQCEQGQQYTPTTLYAYSQNILKPKQTISIPMISISQRKILNARFCYTSHIKVNVLYNYRQVQSECKLLAFFYLEVEVLFECSESQLQQKMIAKFMVIQNKDSRNFHYGTFAAGSTEGYSLKNNGFLITDTENWQIHLGGPKT